MISRNYLQVRRPMTRWVTASPTGGPLLFTIVHEILGSGTEADDVLRNSCLWWAKVARRAA